MLAPAPPPPRRAHPRHRRQAVSASCCSLQSPRGGPLARKSASTMGPLPNRELQARGHRPRRHASRISGDRGLSADPAAPRSVSIGGDSHAHRARRRADPGRRPRVGADDCVVQTVQRAQVDLPRPATRPDRRRARRRDRARSAAITRRIIPRCAASSCPSTRASSSGSRCRSRGSGSRESPAPAPALRHPGLAVAAAIGLGVSSPRVAARPLRVMTAAATRIAQGDYASSPQFARRFRRPRARARRSDRIEQVAGNLVGSAQVRKGRRRRADRRPRARAHACASRAIDSSPGVAVAAAALQALLPRRSGARASISGTGL
jgi:hypothetical protein